MLLLLPFKVAFRVLLRLKVVIVALLVPAMHGLQPDEARGMTYCQRRRSPAKDRAA